MDANGIGGCNVSFSHIRLERIEGFFSTVCCLKPNLIRVSDKMQSGFYDLPKLGERKRIENETAQS